MDKVGEATRSAEISRRGISFKCLCKSDNMGVLTIPSTANSGSSA